MRLYSRRPTVSTGWTEWKVLWRPLKVLLNRQTNWRSSTDKWWACVFGSEAEYEVPPNLLLSMLFWNWLELSLFFNAQLYRLERYNECKSVYTDLIRNSQDEYEEERKTNLAAVMASVSQWENTPLVRTPLQHVECFVCLMQLLCLPRIVNINWDVCCIFFRFLVWLKLNWYPIIRTEYMNIWADLLYDCVTSYSATYLKLWVALLLHLNSHHRNCCVLVVLFCV